MRKLLFDVTTMRSSFGTEQPDVSDIVDRANRGEVALFLPTVAMAEVETEMRTGTDGWAHLLYAPHVEALDLQQHCALEVGNWPGSLAVRQVVHDALSVGAIVVTLDSSLYAGHDIPLLALDPG